MTDNFVGVGKLFKPLAPLVLPAVYDDVLSYEEWLSKVVAHCNALSDYINQTMENLYTDIDKYVDNRVVERLDEFQTEINNVRAYTEDAIKALNDKIDGIDTDVDEKITESEARVYQRIATIVETINIQLSAMQDNIDEMVERSKSYTDSRCDALALKLNNIKADFTVKLNTSVSGLNTRIDNIIREYPRLYDPASGLNEDMQTLVYNLYKRLRYFGAMAMEYDDQQYTAEGYDTESLSAIKYDTLMGSIITKDLREMFNPFTGKWESVRDVVGMLVRKMQWNGKTAGEYDGYQYTAEDFDESTFSAYEQDTNQYITEPQIDKKNKAYKNYLFEGTLDSDNTQISVIIGDKKQVVFSQYDSPINVVADIRSSRISLPSGATIEMSVSGDTVVIILDGTEAVTVYSTTDVYDVSELDK